MTNHELRQWRERRGWSIRRVAAALEVEPSTILRWERADRPMPGAWLPLALAGLACREQHSAPPPTD